MKLQVFKTVSIAMLAFMPFFSFRASAETRRFRFTETSITESGIVDGTEFDGRPKTKGFGVGYIGSCGFGVHYTGLWTIVDGGRNPGLSTAELRHAYIDTSYTQALLGNWLLLAAGAGFGVSGELHYRVGDDQGPTRDSSSFSATSWFLGPGLSLGPLEVYWIHRRNFPRYQTSDGMIGMSSRHYQLGIGYHF